MLDDFWCDFKRIDYSKVWCRSHSQPDMARSCDPVHTEPKEPVLAAVTAIGSSFDDFLREENLYDDVIDGLTKNLNAYAIARDREHYAIALAKTYNRRRQQAYVEYLKALEAVKDQLDAESYRALTEKLETINQFKGK